MRRSAAQCSQQLQPRSRPLPDPVGLQPLHKPTAFRLKIYVCLKVRINHRPLLLWLCGHEVQTRLQLQLISQSRPFSIRRAWGARKPQGILSPPSLSLLLTARWICILPTQPLALWQPPPSSLTPTGPCQLGKGPLTFFHQGFFSTMRAKGCIAVADGNVS